MHDGIGRQIATAEYGTNDGAALVRPDTISERSDAVLVTTTAYDGAGDAFERIGPGGKEPCEERRTGALGGNIIGPVKADHEVANAMAAIK